MDEVWKLTPRKFYALMQIHRAQMKREDLRSSIVAWSSFAAQHGNKCQFKPDSFMISEEEKPQKTWQEMKMIARSIIGGVSGRNS